MESSPQNLYYGDFDIIIISILIVINIITYCKWKNQYIGCIYQIAISIVYFIILPFISQYIEIKHITSVNGLDDDYTLLYTYFRYPLYWSLGLLQLLIIAFFYKQKKDL